MREAVAMSGGVDSSVAALLRVREGADVVGLTMQLWDSDCKDEGTKACCGLEHALDARNVCKALGASHKLLDLREQFRREVVDVFVREYLSGRTPNPCERCNRFLKWDLLWNRARELGCERLSTGHYAKIVEGTDGPELHRGADQAKDQSYFLWGIPRERLGSTIFPLGDLTKPEIRALAAQAALPTAQKRESQDICFVPEGDYRKLVRERGATSRLLEPGPIVGPGGVELGRHEGLASYTIGQRRGVKAAWSEPLYVTALDLDTNTLRLGLSSELLVDRLVLEQENWLTDIADGTEVLAQVRYRSTAHPCRIRRIDGSWTVDLSQPILAPAPGQSVVLYADTRVLGGGVLSRASRSY